MREYGFFTLGCLVIMILSTLKFGVGNWAGIIIMFATMRMSFILSITRQSDGKERENETGRSKKMV